MNKDPKKIVAVKDLWKSYGSLKVLKGLNIDLYQGETLVILGRSGVGKSVLLRQLMGIEWPDKGSINVYGKDILKMSRRERQKIHKDMGMLFQSAALFDSMNVEENVGFFLAQHGDPRNEKSITKDEIKQRVQEALEMVGLGGTQKVMPSDLSGGMRKRAGLARLIVYHPDIMLFDEPTTGLDPITAMQINELIVESKQKLNATSIVVTHDIKSATKVGDRLALHDNGVIKHVATKEEFFNIDDPVIQAFIENASVGKS